MGPRAPKCLAPRRVRLHPEDLEQAQQSQRLAPGQRKRAQGAGEGHRVLAEKTKFPSALWVDGGPMLRRTAPLEANQRTHPVLSKPTNLLGLSSDTRKVQIVSGLNGNPHKKLKQLKQPRGRLGTTKVSVFSCESPDSCGNLGSFLHVPPKCFLLKIKPFKRACLLSRVLLLGCGFQGKPKETNENSICIYIYIYIWVCIF